MKKYPEIQLLAYDHHPDGPTDLEVSEGLVDSRAGATSTLLAEEFQRRGIDPTPLEASLLLMGIYEDTGSLTYPTTGPRDLTAAAWLIGREADLQLVRQYAIRALDPVRLGVLHRMMEEMEVRTIRGHRVGIVAVDLGEYVDELAPLVSRCTDLFELSSALRPFLGRANETP